MSAKTVNYDQTDTSEIDFQINAKIHNFEIYYTTNTKSAESEKWLYTSSHTKFKTLLKITGKKKQSTMTIKESHGNKVPKLMYTTHERHVHNLWNLAMHD